MKNHIKFLEIPFVLLFLSSFFLACDKEFTEIESGVLGIDNSNLSTKLIELPVIAYNKKLGALQSNGLKNYMLGFYDDPIFGQTTASIVTQLQAKTYPDNFGYNPIITSVILSIPYFSTAKGSNTYSLDSLYGSEPIKLSIYKNNYFLRSIDPQNISGGSQKYYTNDEANFYLNDDNIGELLYRNDAFVYSNASVEGEIETEVLSPRLRVDLFKVAEMAAFWKNTFLENKGTAVLSNDNQFKNFFRGLYIKAEDISGKGSLALLDLSKANITINYTRQNFVLVDTDTDAIPDFADADLDGIPGADVPSRDTDGNGIIDKMEQYLVTGVADLNGDGVDDNYKKIEETYVLNFTQNTVNLLKTKYEVIENLTPKPGTGDEKLYLKGAGGSMAVVKLFETKDDLDEFKNKFRVSDGKDGYKFSKLINDVQLVVYEDTYISSDNLINKSHKKDRIYAYDIVNNKPILDYSIDTSQNLQNPFYSKVISLGQRFMDADGLYKYKIRLTEHIKNIILNDLDLDDTKIGLVKSNNVNYNTEAQILNSTDEVTSVPAASVITPRGTILYGNMASEDSKKIKLHVFFTETK